MIRYSLKCDKDHTFESWFASASAFDTLRASGHLSCPDCGSATVEKALMAPAVAAETRTAATPDAPLSQKSEIEQKLAAMRKHIEENSDYVGMNFAKEARAIHDGDAPERAIWGEAKPDEAKSLIEDGIPVAPLPFLPKSRTN